MNGEHESRPSGSTPFDTIHGESAPMVALKVRATRLAALEAPLLILGETGTGKELVARACHLASRHGAAPFLALNCAAMPESLAESELFGYAPGAFSGANRGGKAGLLEQANHGTVFLDEIGEMSPFLQAKLLRFLNDGSFRRVGGDREISVDVRVISATHRDLEEMVAKGLFREDLLYRTNVLGVRVPPLRERGDDVMLLAGHFIDSACKEMHRPSCCLSPEACMLLRTYTWPGNVRQLRNVIYRSVAVTDGTVVAPDDLEIAKVATPAAASRSFDECESLDHAVATFEKGLLEALYARYPSCRLLATRLKVSHTTVANKLRRHGIAQAAQDSTFAAAQS